MLNYQKYHYNQYRVLLEDGTELAVTREECFAPAEEPTKENPLKQRWYYSPDHMIAIRLPRNESGEAIYLVNSADRKFLERDEERKRQCVGEFRKDLCPITCANCWFREFCSSESRDSDGCGCKKKCEDCAYRTSRFRSMDKPVGEDDSGDDIAEDFESGENMEEEFCEREMSIERQEAVRQLVSTLSEEDRRLWMYMREKKTNVEIGRLLGITESPVRKRKKKLAEIFEKAGLKKYL